ncbi:MAG: integrase arm-type DNA-binding domain-containing protein, partial [SAR202 cluster bacterium]|nr:integrase arm-type DNA-binding domain-containing protein [SAR202 cluster bacterium]
MSSLKTNITPELIASLEYKDRPYFVLSSNYPGFRLKINPQGRISFITYGRVHFGGNPRTITHGTTKNLTLAEAIEKHLYTTKLLERGQDPNLIKKSKNKQYAIGLDLESIAIQFISDKEMK